VHSAQGRPVHLLTITSHDEQEKDNEILFDESLFPEKIRPIRFKKPVVLITARVHPGETPASYAMEGVIDFLTSRTDLRAHLLRKMFVFMVVPMINVDGVLHGHFRMDTFGRNLNRFYISPDRQQQPAIFGIKALANHLIADNRLSFYFDLHAHNAKKGCFIYGNAFTDFV
jgi:murein tripeptide amidase MpaA